MKPTTRILLAAALAILTAYVRVLGVSVGTPQYYLGPMAKQHRMAALTAAWDRYFADVDVFLCPTVFTKAFPHDDRHRYDDQVFWIAQASLPGLPAVSAPVGGVRPAGLQVVGPAHEDDTAITFAEFAADVVGGFAPPGAGSSRVLDR